MINGCSNNPVIVSDQLPNIDIILPEPEPLELRNIDWAVITDDNVNEKMKQSPVYFALDKNNYEMLVLNILDISEFMQKQSKVIDSYQKFMRIIQNE